MTFVAPEWRTAFEIASWTMRRIACCISGLVVTSSDICTSSSRPARLAHCDACSVIASRSVDVSRAA